MAATKFQTLRHEPESPRPSSHHPPLVTIMIISIIVATSPNKSGPKGHASGGQAGRLLYCDLSDNVSVFHPRRSWIFPHQFPHNLLSPAIPPGPRYSRQFAEWLAIQCHIYLHSLFKDNGDDLPNALLLFRSTVKWKRLSKDIRSTKRYPNPNMIRSLRDHWSSGRTPATPAGTRVS